MIALMRYHLASRRASAALYSNHPRALRRAERALKLAPPGLDHAEFWADVCDALRDDMTFKHKAIQGDES